MKDNVVKQSVNEAISLTAGTLPNGFWHWLVVIETMYVKGCFVLNSSSEFTIEEVRDTHLVALKQHQAVTHVTQSFLYTGAAYLLNLSQILS